MTKAICVFCDNEYKEEDKYTPPLPVCKSCVNPLKDHEIIKRRSNDRSNTNRIVASN